MIAEQPIQPHKHFPELDGLRGIAILMVLCYHYFPNSLLLNFGWSGVDLFFVLSGYLISSRLIPFLDNDKIILTFYWNRFLRIIPLYFTFLCLFFTGWFLLNSKETISANTYYTDFYWQFIFFIQNWGFINHINDNKIHLQHLWSVAIEEQIYIIFPWILILAKKTKYLLLCFFILFLMIPLCRCYYTFFYINANKEYVKIFWNTFFRADSFLAGAIIYLILNQYNSIKYVRAIKWTGIISFVTIFTYIFITKNAEKNNLFISSIGYTFISLFYSSILISVLQNRNKHKHFILNNAFLRYTGRISYGIYIFHWPLFLLGFAIINKLCLKMDVNLTLEYRFLINTICSIPITYFVSHLSFKYYETFFLNWKIKYAQ